MAKSVGRKSLKDVSIRKIILKGFLKKYNGKAWTGIILAQDRDQWRSFVKRVIKGTLDYVNTLIFFRTARWWQLV